MNLGPMELVVILIVALVIFGPKNLPKLGTSVGKTVKSIREGMEEDDAPKATGGDANEVADAEATSATFCPACGRRLAPDARFCGGCGKRVAGD